MEQIPTKCPVCNHSLEVNNYSCFATFVCSFNTNHFEIDTSPSRKIIRWIYYYKEYILFSSCSSFGEKTILYKNHGNTIIYEVNKYYPFTNSFTEDNIKLINKVVNLGVFL
jgi:hypothetical protein